MGKLTSVAIFVASLVFSASCARPEHRDALIAASKSAQREGKERHAEYCGIRSLQPLGNHAREKDVMDRALAICLEQKPANGCRSLADLWLKRNLTAEFSGSTTFCDLLRPLMSDAGLVDVDYSHRRRRRRREYMRRRRDRRRAVICSKDEVYFKKKNICCTVKVTGRWAYISTVPFKQIIETFFGYTKETTEFNMQETYAHIEHSAEAGFVAQGGASGSASVSSSVGTTVVKSTEITETVQVNRKTMLEYRNTDGRMLHQWAWDSSFHGSQSCRDVPETTVLTPYVQQTDIIPRCLPNYNIDNFWQNCLPAGKM